MSAMEAWILPLDKSSAATYIQIGQFSADGMAEVPYMTRRVASFWVTSSEQQWGSARVYVQPLALSWGDLESADASQGPLALHRRPARQLLNFLSTGAMLIMLLYQLMIFLRRTSDLGPSHHAARASRDRDHQS